MDSRVTPFISRKVFFFFFFQFFPTWYDNEFSKYSGYIFTVVNVLPSNSSDDFPTPHILLKVLIRKQTVPSTLLLYFFP